MIGIIGFFLAIIILLQIFILVGTCRKNYKLDKLDEIDARVSKLNDLLVPGIGINMERTTTILDLLSKMTKKKHKKKKGETFYADNESES